LVRWAPLLLFALVLAAMLCVNPSLSKLRTWDRLPRDWCGEALLALGLTPIIITGGIDLSVGSIVGLSAVVCGYLWREAGLTLEVVLLGGVLTGLLCGMVNGGLVLTGINPLVVTLASLAVFRGLAHGLSGAHVVSDFPQSLDEDWWQASWLGLPLPLWLYALVFGLGYVALHHTWMGRMLFAIGDNPRAARYAGLPSRTLIFSLYALSGLLAGIVGVSMIFRFMAARPEDGTNLELQAIACVVLGGVRITGGWGHLAGTLLGTLSLIVLLEGMAGVVGDWRQLGTGLFLVVVAIANELLARWQLRQATRRVA
jgi:rhamnose transport system permease protein